MGKSEFSKVPDTDRNKGKSNGKYILEVYKDGKWEKIAELPQEIQEVK